MKCRSIIFSILLYPLLLSGCISRYEYGTSSDVMQIPYYYRIEFEYTGQAGSDGYYYDHEKIEYFETEYPYYNSSSFFNSSYDVPEFGYDITPGTPIKRAYSFIWHLDGGGRNPECPLASIALYGIPHIGRHDESGVLTSQHDIPQIESGKRYDESNIYSSQYGFSNCVLRLHENEENKAKTIVLRPVNFSFTKVYDDDSVAYTLRLFAADPLSQPQTIQIDISKKLMAIRGVARNFEEYIIL